MNGSYVDKLSTGNNENVKWKSFSAFLFNKIRFSGLKNVRCRFGNQISAARKFQREQRFANTKADEMLFRDSDRARRIIFSVCFVAENSRWNGINRIMMFEFRLRFKLFFSPHFNVSNFWGETRAWAEDSFYKRLQENDKFIIICNFLHCDLLKARPVARLPSAWVENIKLCFFN